MSRLAVLVSGTGRHLTQLIRLSRSGWLATELALVVASRADVPARQRADEAGIPNLVVDPGDLTKTLEEREIDWVVMAGYLRRWPIPREFEGRTLNIHPSLLPWFGGRGYYGDRVHAAVLASGMRVSGATVHFVTAEYDQGPILAQRAVPVHRDDDVTRLARRVFAAERELLPPCVRALATGEVRLVNGRIEGTF